MSLLINLVSQLYITADGGHSMSDGMPFRNIACVLGLRLYMRFIFEKKNVTVATYQGWSLLEDESSPVSWDFSVTVS